MRVTRAEAREADTLVYALLAAEARGDKAGRDVLLLGADQRVALVALDILAAAAVGLLEQAGITAEQIARGFADRLLVLRARGE